MCGRDALERRHGQQFARALGRGIRQVAGGEVRVRQRGAAVAGREDAAGAQEDHGRGTGPSRVLEHRDERPEIGGDVCGGCPAEVGGRGRDCRGVNHQRHRRQAVGHRFVQRGGHQLAAGQTRAGRLVEGLVERRDTPPQRHEPFGQRAADEPAGTGDEQRLGRAHGRCSATLAGSKLARAWVCSAISRSASTTSCAASARTIGGWLAAMSTRFTSRSLRSDMIWWIRR
jgi:hypothetical protein